MATYSLTQAAALLSSSTDLVMRCQQALVSRAVTRFGVAVGNEAAFCRRIAVNPAGEANAAITVVLSTVSVVATGTDIAPIAPSDAELTAGVEAAWLFLIG